MRQAGFVSLLHPSDDPITHMGIVGNYVTIVGQWPSRTHLKKIVSDWTDHLRLVLQRVWVILKLLEDHSPMVRETGVPSQVESYQRLKKSYLMHPCLTFSIIRYGSRVKGINSGKGVVPSPTQRCSSYMKREPSGRPRLRSPTLLTTI